MTKTEIFQMFCKKHVLVFSLSILTLSRELQSGVAQCAFCLCPNKRVSSLVTQFVNFDPETFVFLGYIVSKNDPSFVLNNNFVYG